MKDKAFWFQLVLSLIVGAGGTGILIAFKERLPEQLYVTFLYIIWSVAVTLLIRLVFGDWFSKAGKWVKKFRQHRRELEQARDLLSKWLELSDLIEDVIKTSWQPSEKQKIKYIELHFWFIKNRPQFLPHWHYFSGTRTNAAHESDFDSTTDLSYKVFRDCYKDPFSYFYEPQILQMLCAVLKRDSDNEVLFVLSKLSELAVEFVQWTKLQ